jgi:hypothetical protein
MNHRIYINFNALRLIITFVDERLNIPPGIVSKAREGDAAAQLTMGKIYLDATSVEDN